MSKLTKRFVESVIPTSKGHVIWDDELPCFGLRVYPSGKRSYLVQYRAKGRSRRYTIGIHGVWTPETARCEAKALLGQIAQGEDPAAEREEKRRAVTVRELCEQYIADMEAGLVLGKGGRPKKATTVATDVGRIRRHIIPLLGTRRIKDITKPDMNNLMKDIIAGKTRVVMKTETLDDAKRHFLSTPRGQTGVRHFARTSGASMAHYECSFGPPMSAEVW